MNALDYQHTDLDNAARLFEQAGRHQTEMEVARATARLRQM